MRHSIALTALYCGIIAAAAAYLLFSAFVPVFGWDVLDYWGPRVVTASTDMTRHSDAIPFLLRFISTIAGPQAVAIVLGVALPLAIAIFVNHILGLIEITGPVRAIAVYCAITIPLVENHAVIRGYSELWVILILVIASAGYIRLIESNGSRAVAILMCLTAAALPFIRSSGASVLVCFVASVLMAGGWHYIHNRFGRWTAALLGSLFFTLLVAVLFPEFRVHRESDGVRLTMMGYDLVLTLNHPRSVLLSNVHALILNLSFNLSYLVFILVLLNLIARCVRCGSYVAVFKTYGVSIFLSVLALLLWLRIIVAQLTTHYVFSVSSPGNDMLGSRELMAASLLAIIAVASICNESSLLSRREPRPENLSP